MQVKVTIFRHLFLFLGIQILGKSEGHKQAYWA